MHVNTDVLHSKLFVSIQQGGKHYEIEANSSQLTAKKH